MTKTSKIASDVAVNTILKAGIQLRGIILIPIISISLGVESYGVYVQVIAIVMLLVDIMNLELNRTLVHMSDNDENNIGTVYSSVTIVSGFLGLLASSLVLYFSDNVSLMLLNTTDHATAFALGGLLIPIRIMERNARNVYRARGNVKGFSFLRTIRAYVTITAVFAGAVVFDLGISLILMLVVFAETIFGGYLQYKMYHIVGLRFPNRRIIKNSLRYSIPLTLATLSGNISDKADKFILGSLLGPTAVGTYSVGYRLSKVILMFVVPLRESYFPEFSDLLKRDETSQIENYLVEGIKYFLLINIPAVAGLFLTADPISRSITSGGINNSISLIVAIISLGLVIFGMDQIYGAVLMADDNTRMLSIFRTIGAVLNVILNFVLIPMFGILGAALATLIAYVLGFIGTFYISQKRISITFPIYSLFMILISTGVMFVVGSYIVEFNIIATIVICPTIHFAFMVLFKEINLKEIYTKIS